MEPMDLVVTMESLAGRSSKNSSISYVINRKGKTMLMHQSRVYLKHKDYKCGDVLWRCASKPCRSFLTLSRGEDIVQMTQHTCERMDKKAHKSQNKNAASVPTAHKQSTTKNASTAHASQSTSKVLNAIYFSQNQKKTPPSSTEPAQQATNLTVTKESVNSASVQQQTSTPQNTPTDPGVITASVPQLRKLVTKATSVTQNTSMPHNTKVAVVNTNAPTSSQNVSTGTQVVDYQKPAGSADCTPIDRTPLVSETLPEPETAMTSQAASHRQPKAKRRRDSRSDVTLTAEQIEELSDIINTITQMQERGEIYYFAKLVQSKLMNMPEQRRSVIMIKICQLIHEECHRDDDEGTPNQ